MSRPSSDEQPTSVLPQQTAEQPAVTTAPATRRARIWSHVPARVGRARTSTLVIGCLFVLLMVLNAALPRPESGTTTITTSDGRTIEIPSSYVPDSPAPTPPPTPTSEVPSDTAPAGTSRAPRTSEEAPESSTAPATTTRAPSPSSTPSSTAPRTSSTSRAPSSSAEPSRQEEPSESSSAPTS
jgi:hypothetical protein